MNRDFPSAPRRVKLLFALVAFVAIGVAVFTAVLMTEPGQSINLPRDWVIAYYANRYLFIGLLLSLLGVMWWLNRRYGIVQTIWMTLVTFGVVLCIVVANFLLALLFPPYQSGASYVSVTTADRQLNDNQVVYAVEINGETKGYPRKHMEIPHIVGATIGGEDVVMTFCPLSNLPMVFDQNVGEQKSELGVLIQTNNNLVMADRTSGELIQQITGQTEFSQQAVRTFPNTMMRWKHFKSRYPNAGVFLYPFNRTLDKIILAAFEGPMQRQFSEEHGPIFPTLAMQDRRLPNKEQVWGVNTNGQQAAFTSSFLESNTSFQFELGRKLLLITYEKETGIARLFERSSDIVGPAAVNGSRGLQQEEERLNELPMHNGVFWMVWIHWFPDSVVFNNATVATPP